MALTVGFRNSVADMRLPSRKNVVAPLKIYEHMEDLIAKTITRRSFLASLASFLSVGLMMASPENGLTVNVAASNRT